MARTDQDRIDSAVKFMKRVAENDSVNRANAIYWRKFRDGQQWPAEIQNSRNLEQRPCVTVNKTDVYCLSVENQQRQQRPRIKVDPTTGGASKRVADIIKGMIRHVESTRGGADMAYDGGFEGADTEGAGYWRVMSDYTRDDSFEQELFLMPIMDPSTVYFDDNSIMPDGSDAEQVLIVSDMPKDSFREAYPDANDGANFNPGDQEGYADWMSKDTIRVAEYFVIEHKRQKLFKLSDGRSVWAEDMPDHDEAVRDQILAAAGLKVLESRDGVKKSVHWYKLTALDVLDHRELPGRWIPVFPCYGRRVVIDGKVRRSGLIKNAIGPAQLANFTKTAIVESVAMQVKAKWLIAEGQDEGHENEWASANISAKATLRYKPTDVDGNPAPPPQRIAPEPPPEGYMALMASVDNDLSSVLGIIEPAQRISGNVSGKALNAERLQSDQNTFHLYDNLTRSIAFTGRYLVDVMKYYYNEPGRVVRIIGDDGKSRTETINQPAGPGGKPLAPGSAETPQQVLNDISVGQYDIVMDTGPGYNTKRQEAVEAMMPLFANNEELMKTAGDVMFRNMDFPGAETIADRLAAANPLSQVDESSDVPPAAQTMIKGLQQKLQEAGQQIQQMDALLKSRADLKAMEEGAESHRLTIKEQGATERARMADHTKQLDTHLKVATTAHDTVLKTETEKWVEEFRGRIAVMLAGMGEASNAREEATENAV